MQTWHTWKLLMVVGIFATAMNLTGATLMADEDQNNWTWTTHAGAMSGSCSRPLFPVKFPTWNTFMNSHAVWFGNYSNGLNNSLVGTMQLVDCQVSIPQNMDCSVYLAVDNYGYLALDGSVLVDINAESKPPSYNLPLNKSAWMYRVKGIAGGLHVISLGVTNRKRGSHMSVNDAMNKFQPSNPGGVAAMLQCVPSTSGEGQPGRALCTTLLSVESSRATYAEWQLLSLQTSANARIDALESQLSSAVASLPTTTTTTTSTTTTTTVPTMTSCMSTSINGVYTIDPAPGTVPPFQVQCAGQANDATGYVLIAQIARSATTLKWADVPFATGALTTNTKLTDAQIDAVWNSVGAEKRMLIRCSGGGTWGSAVANNWFGGYFVSGFRSTCTNIYNGQANPNVQYPFTYGYTIGGWQDGWYQQNGYYGCLTGTNEGLGFGQVYTDTYKTSVTCFGDVQFLIR